MKKIAVAALALGASLALVQLASADTIGAQAGGSSVTANLKTNSNHGEMAAAGSGAQVVHENSQLNSDKDDGIAVVSTNDESASNGMGVRREIGAPGSGHFVFTSGTHAKNAIAKGSFNETASMVALVETPEPESLFLLGTGLLCMALAVFWKSAKRPTEN